MNPDVRLQSALGCETLPTNLTGERLLTCKEIMDVIDCFHTTAWFQQLVGLYLCESSGAFSAEPCP